jgi:hypothetical protein
MSSDGVTASIGSTCSAIREGFPLFRPDKGGPTLACSRWYRLPDINRAGMMLSSIFQDNTILSQFPLARAY